MNNLIRFLIHAINTVDGNKNSNVNILNKVMSLK